MSACTPFYHSVISSFGVSSMTLSLLPEGNIKAFVWSIFRIFISTGSYFRFVVAINDLMQDMKAIFTFVNCKQHLNHLAHLSRGRSSSSVRQSVVQMLKHLLL